MLVKIHSAEPIEVQHGGIGYELMPGVNNVPDDLAVRLERDGRGTIWREERPEVVHSPQPDDIVALEARHRVEEAARVSAPAIEVAVVEDAFAAQEELNRAMANVRDLRKFDIGPEVDPKTGKPVIPKAAPAKKGGKR